MGAHQRAVVQQPGGLPGAGRSSAGNHPGARGSCQQRACHLQRCRLQRRSRLSMEIVQGTGVAQQTGTCYSMASVQVTQPQLTQATSRVEGHTHLQTVRRSRGIHVLPTLRTCPRMVQDTNRAPDLSGQPKRKGSWSPDMMAPPCAWRVHRSSSMVLKPSTVHTWRPLQSNFA